MMKSLLLGCGNSRVKKVHLPGSPNWAGELVAIDMNPNCGADIVADLSVRPLVLPFPDDTFDEVGAFDFLEHVGRQGDWKGYFEEFTEYWRVMKPGGLFYILVPIGSDYHADPGHTRFFSTNWFWFLDQSWYADCLAKGLQVTDYRWFYKVNFKVLEMTNHEGHHLAVVLRKEPA